MLDGEEKLIREAIAGEASAFGLLYDKYQPVIYRFIYIKISHREEAEDLTHQVFLRAWENIYTYEFRGFSFSSWLYYIARNKVIDHYRTRKITIDIESIQISEEIKPNEKTIDEKLEIKKIKNAITKLRPVEQDVLIMRFIEELSPKEVAGILKKSEGSIRLIQHKALKNLKKILNGQGTD